jgi:capsular exopolysaccharide synthesis family protein
MPNSAGLSSLIVGEGTLETAIRATGIPALSILPCGPVPPNPAELLHTGGFDRLLSLMKEHFDRIIIDSPPVGVVADAAVMSTQVDGTLMVLKAGRTSRDLARQGIRQLRDVNARILGALLNDLDLQGQKYGQYAYYQYGYYYGERGRSEENMRSAEVDISS